MQKTIRKPIVWFLLGLVFIAFLGLYQYLHISEYAPNKARWEPQHPNAKMDAAENFVITGEKQEETVALKVPVESLPIGTYTATIYYYTNNQQKCEIYSGSHQNFVKANPFQLFRGRKEVIYHFTVTKKCTDAAILIKYFGGYLRVSNISVKSNMLCIKLLFALYLTAWLLLLVYWKKVRPGTKNRFIWGSLLGITLLASLPLFTHELNLGHDLVFHLPRIEGLVQGLKHGDFPVRMNLAFNDGYGFPCSIYYGDLLLYIPAMFRILGFSISTSYKLYVFLINGATAFTMWYAAKQILQNEKTALICSLVYTTASYRLVDIYVRCAVGEYTSLVFFPLIALAMYRIYHDDPKDWKRYKTNAYFLAGGMTALIYTHILSVEMVVIILTLIAVVKGKQTFRKTTMAVYGYAVALTLLLCMSFIVPFLDYYLKVDTLIKVSSGNVQYIQDYGARLSDYFSVFRDYFGGGYDTPLSDRMQLSPGLILMGAAVAGILLCIIGKADKTIKSLTAFSVVLLWIASNWFPWNYLAATGRIGNMVAQVQFPWRYIGLAIVPLTFLMGYFLQNAPDMAFFQKPISGTAICVAGILMMLFFISNYQDNIGKNRTRDYAELRVNLYNEYALNNTDVNNLSGDVYAQNAAVSDISSNGLDMSLQVDETLANAYIEFPRFNYPNYVVTGANGEEFDILDGENRVIRINLPYGYTGALHLQYDIPPLWKAAEGISLLSFLALVFLYAIRKRRRTVKGS